MSYLIFNSTEEATARSDQAGEDKPLPYHRGDNDVTRYMWAMIPAETSALVNELPADWTHPPNPFE